MRLTRNLGLSLLFILLLVQSKVAASEWGSCEMRYEQCVYNDEEDMQAGITACSEASTMQMCIDAGHAPGGACHRAIGVDLNDPAHPQNCLPTLAVYPNPALCDDGMVMISSNNFHCVTVPADEY